MARTKFGSIAAAAARATGSPYATAIAAGVVLTWALSGPLFGFSETWQLVINTGTTIVTFLMVFLLQHAQNRDTEAIQEKLDELIRSIPQADNAKIAVEEVDL